MKREKEETYQYAGRERRRNNARDDATCAAARSAANALSAGSSRRCLVAQRRFLCLAHRHVRKTWADRQINAARLYFLHTKTSSSPDDAGNGGEDAPHRETAAKGTDFRARHFAAPGELPLFSACARCVYQAAMADPHCHNRRSARRYPLVPLASALMMTLVASSSRSGMLIIICCGGTRCA